MSSMCTCSFGLIIVASCLHLLGKHMTMTQWDWLKDEMLRLVGGALIRTRPLYSTVTEQSSESVWRAFEKQVASLPLSRRETPKRLRFNARQPKLTFLHLTELLLYSTDPGLGLWLLFGWVSFFGWNLDDIPHSYSHTMTHSPFASLWIFNFEVWFRALLVNFRQVSESQVCVSSAVCCTTHHYTACGRSLFWGAHSLLVSPKNGCLIIWCCRVWR